MNKRIYLFTLVVLLVSPATAYCFSHNHKNIVVFNSESLTSGIQEAIDNLPIEGGVVFLPAGVYLLRKPIVLRDNVTLEGSGEYSVLTIREPMVTSITKAAISGDTILFVQNAKLFHRDDTISIYDQKMKGWYTFTTTIVDILANNKIKIANSVTFNYGKPENYGKPKYFSPERNAVVTNIFPLIVTNTLPSDEPKYNITIKNISINYPQQKDIVIPYNFVLSAIHIVNTYNISIRNCRIMGSFHDGISFQSGGDLSISDCKVYNCNGHGFHPGTGMKRGIIHHNFSINNKRDGLYYCCRVQELIVDNNIFSENRGYGLGGLGAGCGGIDSFNIVSNNIITKNGKYGIQLIKGRNNIITSNIISHNVKGQIKCVDTTNSIISQNCCAGSNKCIDVQDKCHDGNKIIDNINEISW